MDPFRVGFVPGVMPDTWARRWREHTRRPLDLVPVDVADQLDVLNDGSVAMCLARGPVDTDVFHRIPLYDEVPVVVVPAEHPVTAYDEIDIAELGDETDLLAEHPDLSVGDAIATVAAGTGIVVVPMSLARVHHRKDVAWRPVTGVDPSPVGLVWLRTADEPDLETFIGAVRGRTVRSTRGRAG